METSTTEAGEAAAHAHAKALVEGNVGVAFLGMTPEGLAGAMEIGNTTWNIMSYEIENQRLDGEDFLVDIIYFTDLGRLPLHYRFQDVEGIWKVAGVERDA